MERADNGTLTGEHFNDGTFTVSSVGNIAGKYFVPTILTPATAIIAIGKAHKKPNFVEGSENQWEPIDCISFSMTADHRVIDGATVARFSERMKALVENPNLMLISI